VSAETSVGPSAIGGFERGLGGIAAALRSIVRRCRSERADPRPAARAIVLLAFVPAFGLWMALRWTLMLLRQHVRVQAITDEGHLIACPLPDMIPMYLYLFGVWEPDVTAYISRALRPGDTIIDVGANHGAFALLAAGIVGASGRVVGVEALPSMAASLRGNIAENRRRRGLALAPIDVIVAAASDRTGELTIYEGPFENLGRTTTLAERGERAAATVPCAPLADLVDADALRAARLIKIDVEGAEPAVLAGLAPALDALRDDVEIMVELSPHWWPDGAPDPSMVLAPYLAAGFRVYELPNDYWPWRYAFPKRVAAPTPLREPLGTLKRRVDLVLSRRDLPAL